MRYTLLLTGVSDLLCCWPKRIEVIPLPTTNVLLQAEVLGTLPNGALVNHTQGIELYDRGRFFTITGHSYLYREITDAQRAIESLSADAQPVEERSSSQRVSRRRTFIPELASTALTHSVIDKVTPYRLRPLSTEQIIDRLRRERRSSRLWVGDTSGYPTQSEADSFMARRILYLAGLNRRLAAEIFCQSGLARPKLSEYRTDETYLDLTLTRATEFLVRGQRNGNRVEHHTATLPSKLHESSAPSGYYAQTAQSAARDKR